MAAGCAGPSPVPSDHFYRLPELNAASLDRPVLLGTLSIAPFSAGGLYNERSIIYVDENQPLELKRYRYHLWNNTPVYLLQQHLADYLKKIGIAEQVVIFQPGVESEYKLSGNVSHFERVVGNGVDQVKVSLTFLFISPGNSTQAHEYQVSFPVQGGGIHDSVEAFGAALQQIYDALVQDVGQSIR
jgi:ABC-type uncharacterized transport system auxiliary subunit